LIRILASFPLPSKILIQIPPAIPTLAIAQIYSVIFDIPLIIDWHNYAYSIMQITLPDSFSLVVGLAKWYFDSTNEKVRADIRSSSPMHSLMRVQLYA
jgi:beta-1,4-mannosyltransferase